MNFCTFFLYCWWAMKSTLMALLVLGTDALRNMRILRSLCFTLDFHGCSMWFASRYMRVTVSLSNCPLRSCLEVSYSCLVSLARL